MANVPISKIQVPGSEDTLLLRDSTAANKVQSATNGNLAGLDANGNLTDSGVSASSIGNLSGSHLGICETAASTSAKIVTIGDGTWIPKEGDIIGVKFTYSNTALFVTLNVNGTGNKSIWYGDSVDPSGADYICGKADSYIFYMYDGTYWIWLNEGQHDGNNFPSVAVYTQSNQQVKIGTCDYYTLTNKSYCHFIFRYPNTCKDMLFMKINNSSSKTIYINGEISSSTNYTLPAGTYIAYYEDDKWYFRTDGILPAKTTEGAEINERLDKTTTSASGNPISITGLKSNQLAVNPVITFEPIQAGSGDPSPSNVRAISGYDKIEVLSVSKNIWGEKWETGSINNTTGQNETDNTNIRQKDYIVVKPNQNYYLSCSVALRLYWYDASYGFISSVNTVTTEYVATSPSNAKYLRIRTTNNYGASYKNDIMVAEGSASVSYVASNKTTDLSEPLPQTVYGMTLYPREGKGVIDREIVDMGDLEYTYNSSGAFFQNTSISRKYGANILCISSCYTDVGDKSAAEMSSLTTGKMASNNNNVAIKFKNTNYTDPSAFKTAMVGQKIVYPLATPIEIQLTPHEISLLKDYAYVSTNGTSIALDYHNGEIATLGDVAQLGETVNELADINMGEVVMQEDVVTDNLGTITFYKLRNGLKAIKIADSSISSSARDAVNVIPSEYLPTINATKFMKTWTSSLPRSLSLLISGTIKLMASTEAGVSGLEMYF